MNAGNEVPRQNMSQIETQWASRRLQPCIFAVIFALERRFLPFETEREPYSTKQGQAGGAASASSPPQPSKDQGTPSGRVIDRTNARHRLFFPSDRCGGHTTSFWRQASDCRSPRVQVDGFLWLRSVALHTTWVLLPYAVWYCMVVYAVCCTLHAVRCTLYTHGVHTPRYNAPSCASSSLWLCGERLCLRVPCTGAGCSYA
ncbi:hypothetical protein K431DRAFT_68394 [Polychaeton citri CBS 116435]|uniref:Uncharacterized protein n=1 Tax=Polychaeton citri CBS 116435 TaxID=1314669 RepID=A0A9P4Q6J3_9PEZI|nr:hypothetical protein K431DRAFT_68394 [Polychaeton citri CBS 116435]